MATKPLSSVAEGSIVKIKENGTPVEFYVAKHDYESGLNGAGRTLVVRKDAATTDNWAGNTNDWVDSHLYSWLNGSYLNRLDADIQGVLQKTKYHYVPGGYRGMSVTTREDYVFALSGKELGFSDKYLKSEGERLPISNVLKPLDQWTRSPRTYNEYTVFFVGSGGGLDYASAKAYQHGYRPVFCLPATIAVRDDGQIAVNKAPAITGTDGALGGFGMTPTPRYAYTVTDPDGDSVTVTVAVDGETKRTFTATLGKEELVSFNESEWLGVLNGSHTITITADDGKGGRAVRTQTFTKSVTRIEFLLSPPLDAAEMPTKAMESITRQAPAGATLQVLLCNNGFDAAPTWEDVTSRVLAGEKIFLKNTTKTAEKWGYNVKVIIERNGATGECWCSGGSGFFE